jgi:hypothetical protein
MVLSIVVSNAALAFSFPVPPGVWCTMGDDPGAGILIAVVLMVLPIAQAGMLVIAGVISLWARRASYVFGTFVGAMLGWLLALVTTPIWLWVCVWLGVRH